MELQFLGANCIRIATKKAMIVVDDNLSELGIKSVTKTGDTALFTGVHGVPGVSELKLIIDQPGEYEVADVAIQGIAARSHMDEEGRRASTIYKIVAYDIRVGILGHIYPELNDAQLEALGTVDVLFVPVGGNGYTLDAVGALQLIKKIEPKIVIPTHFADQEIKYPVPQNSLEEALKELAMEPAQTLTKFKVKPAEFTDTVQLFVLER